MSYNTSGKIQDEIFLKDLLIKVKDWFFYLRVYWLKLLLATLLGAGLGLLYAILSKPKYTAVLSFAIEDDKSSGGGLTGALGIASQFGIDIGSNAGGAFNGPNLVELMKSRAIIEKTLLQPLPLIPQKSLADFFIEITEMKTGWSGKSSLLNIQYPPNSDRSKYTIQQDSILGLIYKSLSKKMLKIAPRDKKLSIVDVTITSENEMFSKFFVEILTQVVSQFYIETKTRKQISNLQILQHQYDSVRIALNEAITGVATAIDNTFSLNPGFIVKRTPSQKKQIDVQVNTAVLTELIKNLELAKVTLRKETPLIQIIDKPILPLEKIKPRKLISLIVGGFFTGLSMLIYLIFNRLIKS